MARRETVFDI